MCISRGGADAGIPARHAEPLAAAALGFPVVSAEGDGAPFVHAGSSTFRSGMVAAEGSFTVRVVGSGLLRGANPAAVGAAGTRMALNRAPWQTNPSSLDRQLFFDEGRWRRAAADRGGPGLMPSWDRCSPLRPAGPGLWMKLPRHHRRHHDPSPDAGKRPRLCRPSGSNPLQRHGRYLPGMAKCTMRTSSSPNVARAGSSGRVKLMARNQRREGSRGSGRFRTGILWKCRTPGAGLCPQMISVRRRAGSTPVRRSSSPWFLKVNRWWSMPRRWSMVACRSRTWTVLRAML